MFYENRKCEIAEIGVVGDIGGGGAGCGVWDKVIVVIMYNFNLNIVKRYLVISIILLFGLMSCGENCIPEDKIINAKDGSFYSMVFFAKMNIDRPQTFEHIATGYSRNKNDYVVIMEFRNSAKNGGYNRLKLTAVVKCNGEIKDILSMQEL